MILQIINTKKYVVNYVQVREDKKELLMKLSETRLKQSKEVAEFFDRHLIIDPFSVSPDLGEEVMSPAGCDEFLVFWYI